MNHFQNNQQLSEWVERKLTSSEQAGNEMVEAILDVYKKYGLAPTHLALLSIIDVMYYLDSEDREVVD